MKDDLEIFMSIATILAAIISAWALIKVNRIDNQDRIRRALWTMEQYMIVLGKCIENPSEENTESYKSIYMLCNLYADEWLRMELQTIDGLMKAKDMEAIKNAGLNLAIRYSEKYKMRIYMPRKKWINFK